MVTKVRYEGSLRGAFDLVEALREAGLEVEWVPPPEERTSAVETIAIAIAARGSYDVLVGVIRRIKERFGSDVSVSVEDPAAAAEDEETGEPSKPS